MQAEMSTSDIVGDLKDWLGRLGAGGAGPRGAASAREGVDLVRRAIAEINALRERLGERCATETIAAEDLNASNDE